jgi:hypothetical protein
MLGGNYVRVQDDAASEADRHARRGEWDEAEVQCARAIAQAAQLREREPEELAYVSTLAELQYFHAEILRHVDRIDEAIAAAQAGHDLYQALLGNDPVHVADRTRDARSRLGMLELLARDAALPVDQRIAFARTIATEKPGPETELDLARQLAWQAQETSGAAELPLLEEAVSIYRRLRPLGEDDLDLFGRIVLRAAEAFVDSHSYAEALACATDAGQAFNALSVRRPERYERLWFDAREIAAQSRAFVEE